MTVRPKYSAALRREAVRQVLEEGLMPSEVGNRLGIKKDTLKKWLQRHRKQQNSAHEGSSGDAPQLVVERKGTLQTKQGQPHPQSTSRCNQDGLGNPEHSPGAELKRLRIENEQLQHDCGVLKKALAILAMD